MPAESFAALKEFQESWNEIARLFPKVFVKNIYDHITDEVLTQIKKVPSDKSLVFIAFFDNDYPKSYSIALNLIINLFIIYT